MMSEKKEKVWYDTRFDPPIPMVLRNGFWVNIPSSGEDVKFINPYVIYQDVEEKPKIAPCCVRVFYKTVRKDDSIPDFSFSLTDEESNRLFLFKIVRKAKDNLSDNVYLVSDDLYYKDDHPSDEEVIDACKKKILIEISKLEKEMKVTNAIAERRSKENNTYNLHYIHQTQFSISKLRTDRKWKQGINGGKI